MARPSRPLPHAPSQLGTFTTGQAYAAGWTKDALRHGVSSGRIDRLWDGVYAEPVPDDAAGRDRRRVQSSLGAALSGADLVVSHLAAARLFGWPTWATSPQACVTTASSRVTRVGPDVHVHRSRFPAGDRLRAGTVHLTAPARTVVDIAREFGVESAVVSADAGLRLGHLDHAGLHDAIRRGVGKPGIVAARAVLDLLDPRSESPLESRSRVRLTRLHVAAPATQVTITDLDGRFVARGDFYWDHAGVIGEADGRGKLVAKHDLIAEKAREDRLRDLGLEVVRWSWNDLTRMDQVVDRLDRAFRRGGARTVARRWIAHLTDDVVASGAHGPC